MSALEIIRGEVGSPVDVGIHTDRLKNNPAVSLPPEYIFDGFFTPELLDVFADYADEFKDMVYSEPRKYPNARLLPAYQPSTTSPNNLPFIAAWGKGTEFPHPRSHMVSHYFGRWALARASINRRSLEKLVLDATGLTGYFSQDESGRVNARVAHGKKDGAVQYLEFKDLSSLTVEDALAESLGEASLCEPLRFAAGVRHNTRNGYIANSFEMPSDHNPFRSW